MIYRRPPTFLTDAASRFCGTATAIEWFRDERGVYGGTPLPSVRYTAWLHRARKAAAFRRDCFLAQDPRVHLEALYENELRDAGEWTGAA